MQQTIPAEEVKTVQTEHFLCPNCGGNLRYDIKRQLYCCESCGSPDEIIPLHEGIREYPLDGYHSREAQNVAFEGASCVFCQNCGAQILFGQYDTATVCPMCGSTQVDVKKQEEFQMTYQEEDMLYLLQGYGIQSSGGYSIRVEKVSENDTELHVKTKLIGPKGKDGGTEGISCPYLVIKVENRHKKVVFD